MKELILDNSIMEGPLPTVIAEIGGNHNGSFELAVRMVDAVADAGGKFVKFQTYIPDRLVSPRDLNYEAFKCEALSFQEFRNISEHSRKRGVTFLSTPFDEESVDFLDELGVPAYKIASGDLTHLPLIQHVAEKQKPLLLSVGASTNDEIDRAVECFRSVSSAELVLLYCVAAYPAQDNEIDLKCMHALQTRYHSPIGFSDHTTGIDVALGAVALGAQVIEKHFTVDQALNGGDNEMSILPMDLTRLIEGSRRICEAMGSVERRLAREEEAFRSASRRSIVLKRSIGKDDLICDDDLLIVRPGSGIPPNELHRVVGCKAKLNLEALTVLQWDHLSGQC